VLIKLIDWADQFYKFTSLKSITRVIETADRLEDRNTLKPEQIAGTERRNINQNVDLMDFKRGCCGTLLVFLLIIGCLAINMVANS
jgi:hypothetical protein